MQWSLFNETGRYHQGDEVVKSEHAPMKLWREYLTKLPQLRGNRRLGLWSLLCILTLLIFLYPAHLHYQYAIIQSINVFANLPLFCALFYVWFAILMVLLIFPGSEGKRRDWENVALLGIFILVFSGIWVSMTNGYNGEFTAYVSQSNNMVETGRIPTILPAFGTTDYPGLPLLLSVTRLITGLETFNGMAALLLVNMLLYSTLLYLLFRNLLKEPSLAALGSLILIMGNREVSLFLPNFHPRGFALVFFVVLLLLLFRGRQQPEQGRTGPTLLLSIILFTALTTVHFATSLVFVIILVGIYLVGIFSRKNLVELSGIVLFLVIALAWQTYVAVSMNTLVANEIYSSLRSLLRGELISGYFLNVSGSYFGAAETPLWTNIIRYFWLLLIMGLGSVIGLIKLFKIRSLPPMEKKLLGGLVGLGIFVILTLVASGLDQGMRVLYYLPLFAIPLMLGFLYSLRNIVRRYILATLVIIIIAASFLTFLVHNDRVGGLAAYSQEIDSSRFLSSVYGKGEELQVVGDGYQWRLVMPDMPNTNYQGFLVFFNPFFSKEDPLKHTWEELEMLTSHFEEPRDPNINNSLFIYSPRLAATFMYAHRVDPTGYPQWQELQDRLSQQSLIYNNGFTEVYHAEANK